MLRLTLFLAGILLALTAGAQAQPMSGATCQTFFAGDASDAPNAVRAFLSGKAAAGAALRVCDLPEASEPTYELRGPVRATAGVCVFDTLDVTEQFTTRSPEGGAAGILSDPQFATVGRHHMLSTGGKCPAQDDRNYILTAGLTPSLFKLLLESWTQASSSRAEFQAALGLRPQPESARGDDAEFMAMMAEHFGQPLQVQGAYLGMIDPLIASYFLALNIKDPSDPKVDWIVGFEFVDGRLKLAIIQAV